VRRACRIVASASLMSFAPFIELQERTAAPSDASDALANGIGKLPSIKIHVQQTVVPAISMASPMMIAKTLNARI
jgi:hypothetical protein